MIIFALVLSKPIFAKNTYYNCFNNAGEKYNINIDILMAVAYTESSFDPHAINCSNRDESCDYGLMQINSWWLNELKQYDLDIDDLLKPCLNIHIGAWILASNFQSFGYSWDTIGKYNVGNKSSKAAIDAKMKYIKKVKENYVYFINKEDV
ncbi:hypothetical protein ABT56_18885 [Photobacterium aquae]|uniref:Transglycosylase SLT domain-containing protein n=1 Tax=Photobacterium aquae TaxID=1195763 RepID=A0A0J1GVT8_9GAMM|nr:lytic transglycosylase domain-containing protein [Photobacterium aquae]KLV03564.1 hypothetical protein ABT56_18885 [Photobacterium aquae]